MIQRCLITGAQGFIGRYLVERLLSTSAVGQILGIGRSPYSEGAFTHFINAGRQRVRATVPPEFGQMNPGRYRYQSIDIFSKPSLTKALRDFQPNIICHLASGLRDDSPDYLFRTNVGGTIMLMEAIAESTVCIDRVLVCSTGGVYGRPDSRELPLTEENTCRPVDLYSASKLAAEHVATILAAGLNIPVVICRLFNLVGAGQDERHVCGKFASWISAISRKEIPSVIETGSLRTTRDFIDVRDCAAGLEILMSKGKPGYVYNIASGIETTIGDVLKRLLEIAGLEGAVEIRLGDLRQEDIPRHYSSIQRLRDLSFEPEFALERSLRDLLDYYQFVRTSQAVV